jgi:hypoxanthine phosphoribosyltransferase
VSLASRLKIKKTLFSAEQIQARVAEIAKKIRSDYDGKDLHIVCVLENGFMFMSDLVRHLGDNVICQFVRPQQRESMQGKISTIQIHFGPEVDVRGKNVLLLEGIIQSGVTSEFLSRNLLSRGAASVAVAAFLDKHSERRVSLRPEYYGFLLDESYAVGYGLGAPEFGRNLPYVAVLEKE